MAREDLEGQIGGGGYNNFEFTVTDAWFGPSEAFSAKAGFPAIFMHWVGKTTLDDVPTLDADGFHPSFMLKTDDWEVIDGGKSVKWVGNPSTPAANQRLGKWYGRLLDEIKDNEEMNALPEGQHPFDGPPGMARQATTWIGTRWFMQEKAYQFSKDNPNLSDASHLMPVRYLGKADVSAPAAAPTAAPAAAGSADLRSQAAQLATSIDDYKIWQSTVLAIPGVAQDTALVMEIADESKLYASARS